MNKNTSTRKPFGFPFDPYPIQRQLMNAIYNSAEQGHISIFESPTGTGKSLSTICASLTWLEENEKRHKEDVERRIRELSLSLQENVNDSESDWVNVHKQKMDIEQKLEELKEEKSKQQRIEQRLTQISQDQKEFRESGKKKTRTLRRGKRSRSVENDIENSPLPLSSSDIINLNENNDSFRNKDRDLLLSDSEDENDQKKISNNSLNGGETGNNEPQVLKCNKLIYASRTHSQLEQFVKELQKTSFKPRVLTLGSRQMLCINEEVRELGEGKLINDRCNELLSTSSKNTEEGKKPKMEHENIPKNSNCGCSYAKGDAIEELSDAILAINEDEKFLDQAKGIAQLVKLGRQRHGCPYYASKTALGLSQLILVPYHILLHKRTRQAWNLDLMGNVIIVDEAHNLLQTLASIHTVELSNTQLDVCCQCLKDYMEYFQDRLSQRNLRNVRQLHCLAFSMYQFLGSISKDKGPTDGTVIDMAYFFAQLGDAINIDLCRLLLYLENSQLCRKLRNFRIRYRPQVALYNPNPTPVNITPLYQLRDFIEALTSRSEDARIVIDRTNIRNPRLRFILLNPAEKLRDIVNECRSLILLGGTMRPVDQLMDAFKRICKIPQNRIKVFSCGHVIGPKQLLAMSIGKGPDDKPLSLNFANRDSESVLRSLAQSFINLIRQIPNGVVAFFPSYAFLGTFMRSIRSSGHLEQLEKRKEIFIETPAGNEETSIWPSFCKAAVTSRGALLMAVVGGKLSEGINFSDELGRCVLMVGVPYPNKQSAELQERMKFVEQTIGQGAGSRFYEQLCLQSLNQAIGRVIRHKNDYAVILLLDQRFTQQFLGNGLPGWIKQRLMHTSNFSEALGSLIKFFRLHKQPQPLLTSTKINCIKINENIKNDDDNDIIPI